jgi:hypothetical protein
VNAVRHMDWATRLAWGLLAWPMTIALALLLSMAIDPHGGTNPILAALLGLAEVVAAGVAIVFTIWALFTWDA